MTNADSEMQKLRLRAEALQWREVEGEVIALEEGSATYLAANTAGSALWEKLAEGTTRARLVAELVGRFGIDEQRAGEDVDKFLQQLAAQNLLEQEP
jgi:coenzyme PQQ synthesis protein D (PqqD)